MATMIDNLLTARNVSTTPVPAAAGSGAAGAPPAAPLTPAAPVPAPPATPAIPADSALAKALDMGKSINAAANAQMATDPLTGLATDSLQRMRENITAAQAEQAARTAKAAALDAQPLPERIPVPRMVPLPPVPTLEEIAKERGVKPEDFNNPMRVFGQMMPLLVAFGALATQRPGIDALNAATAAMGAVKAGDKEAYDKAHKEWLEKTKVATDTQNQIIREYEMKRDDRSLSVAERQAEYAKIFAAHNDSLAAAAMEGGYLDRIDNLFRMRKTIADPLTQLTQLTMTEEQNKREIAFRTALEWAKIEADKNPAFISTDKVVGTILRKMATDPASVTDGDKAALAEAYKQRKASQPMFGGMVPGADGEPAADAAGATVPAPAAAAGAAKPAAPATTPPPVSMLKEGVVLTLNPPGGGAQQRWTLRGGKQVFLGTVPAS